MKYIKTFEVSNLEIDLYEDGSIEVNTGGFSQAFLDNEQILTLIDILNDVVYGIEGDE